MNYQKALDQYKEILGHTEVDSVARLKFLVSLLDEKEDEPWYPDNSGGWFEIAQGTTLGLPGHTKIEVLTAEEREEKNYRKRIFTVNGWGFPDNEVVAYKVVK